MHSGVFLYPPTTTGVLLSGSCSNSNTLTPFLIRSNTSSRNCATNDTLVMTTGGGGGGGTERQEFVGEQFLTVYKLNLLRHTH